MKGHAVRALSLLVLSVVWLSSGFVTNGQSSTRTCEPITISNSANLTSIQILDYEDVLQTGWSWNAGIYALASSSGVHLIETDDFTLMNTLPTSSSTPQIRFSQTDPYLALAEDDLQIWDLDLQTVHQLADFTETDLRGGIRSPTFSSDGDQAAALVGESNIRVWDVATGAQTYEYEIADHGFGNYLAFTPDDAELIFASIESIVILDASNPQILRTFEASSLDPLVPRIIDYVAINPTGDTLAVVSGYLGLSNSYLTFLGAERLEFWGDEISYENGRLVAFSPDGRLIAVSRGVNVDIWRLEDETLHGNTQHPLTHLVGHESDLYDIVFSPDGRFIASVSRQEEEGVPVFQEHSTIIIWGVCTG